MFKRSAGLILHPSSLPSDYGIGELGSEAYAWVDGLQEAGITLWQMMPLGPTGYGDSPYQCFSAFAGNPYLISLEVLLEQGLLEERHLDSMPSFESHRVDFGSLIPWKISVLEDSFETFKKFASIAMQESFALFCKLESHWLNDYALFMSLKELHEGVSWDHWQEPYKKREPNAMSQAKEDLHETIQKYQYWQWLFFAQWLKLKDYANHKGIEIIGDIPIFVAYDSADTWANPELFYLNPESRPSVVAGVPPDYFSETGQ